MTADARPAERVRAEPPVSAPAPPSRGLDAVVAGRTIRAWITSCDGGDAASEPCRAARAALRSDPEATVAAIVESLRGAAAGDRLPRLLAWLLPDVRDLLVPRLLDLLGDGTARGPAMEVLRTYAESRGFGPHDALVADVLSKHPADDDTAWILGSLGSAFAPVASRVVGPLPATGEPVAPDPWIAPDAAASAVAPLLLPPEKADERSVGDPTVMDWLRRNAPDVAVAVPALRVRLAATTDDAERSGILRVLAQGGSADGVAEVVRRTRDGSESTRAAACRALGECPVDRPDVVPALVARLSDDDEDVRYAAWDGLARHAAVSDAALAEIAWRLTSPDRAIADAAATAIRGVVADDAGHFGRARRTPPLLGRFVGLADPAVRAAALRAAGPGDVPAEAVAAFLDDPDDGVRAAARRLVLRPAGARTDSAAAWFPAFVSCEWGEAPQARFESVLDDFQARGGRIADLLDEVRRALRRNRPDPMQPGPDDAAIVARRLGMRAAPLRDAVTERLTVETSGETHDLLVRAFAATGGDAFGFLLPRIEAGETWPGEFDETLRILAAASLPAIRSALARPESEVRRACAVALGGMGVPPDTAELLLVPLLADADRSVQFAAAASLLRLGRRADLTSAFVRRELDVWPAADEDAPVARRIRTERDLTCLLSALADAGPAALPAVDVLARALRSQVAYAPHVNLVCRALRSCGPRAAPAVPELTALVDHRSPLEAMSAATGFSSGPPPDLEFVAVGAAEALGAIGPAARSAVTALRRAEHSTDRRMRAAATAALAAIGGR